MRPSERVAISNLRSSWFRVDFRNDPRGRWCGEGELVERATYRDPHEQMEPSPWIPRIWYAEDLPELAAEK